jgi:hypothetical protein
MCNPRKSAGFRALVLGVTLAGAACLAPATGVAGTELGRSVTPQPVQASLQIKVMYQAGPAGDTAADVPAPRQKNVSLPRGESPVHRARHGQHALHCAVLGRHWPSALAYPLDGGNRLGADSHASADQEAAALIDIVLAATDLKSLKTAKVGGCEIGMPDVSSSKMQQTVVVPLNGAPVRIQLEDGVVLTMKTS